MTLFPYLTGARRETWVIETLIHNCKPKHATPTLPIDTVHTTILRVSNVILSIAANDGYNLLTCPWVEVFPFVAPQNAEIGCGLSSLPESFIHSLHLTWTVPSRQVVRHYQLLIRDNASASDGSSEMSCIGIPPYPPAQ
jgi:hypothetical protein